jgi:hypothetical protein
VGVGRKIEWRSNGLDISQLCWYSTDAPNDPGTARHRRAAASERSESVDGFYGPALDACIGLTLFTFLHTSLMALISIITRTFIRPYDDALVHWHHLRRRGRPSNTCYFSDLLVLVTHGQQQVVTPASSRLDGESCQPICVISW